MPDETFAAPAAGREPADAGSSSERDLKGALHDVANALTVVLGWLELAAKDAAEQGDSIRRLAVARAWARHGRGIALRAIGGSRGADAEDSSDLASLLLDAVAGAEPQAIARGVVLQVQQPSESVALRAWPQALQVVTNLLLNAIAFSPPQSTVLVQAFIRGEAVRLVISDEGPGIEAANRSRIFDGVPSSRPGGSGVGLAHARALAEAEGGALRLLDAEHGAVFEVDWPLCGQQSRSQVVPRRRASLAGKRVLVFDDDPAVLSLLQTGLEARGAQVVTATDARGLRGVMGDGLFDAALIDLSPLADDSAGAIAAMRAASPAVRVVLISGSAVAPPPVALEAACAWVRKPFEMGEIASAILGEEGL